MNALYSPSRPLASAPVAIEAITAACAALAACPYSTISFCNEPLEVVEAVAKHFGAPVATIFYEADERGPASVILSASFQVANTYVGFSATRRPATAAEIAAQGAKR